jgi:hypothetical protein
MIGFEIITSEFAEALWIGHCSSALPLAYYTSALFQLLGASWLF